MSGLAALQSSLLARGDTADERVEVNQRHLIDKILARYSAEFTVFRELIQNANDAGAESVDVHFQSAADSDDNATPAIIATENGGVTEETKVTTSTARALLRQPATTITVRNNGRAFAEADWRRLKSIAEGNPDVDKVGFFGVGFYSLFSVCEEPFIQSGKECMAFFWKGDALYTRRGPSPDAGEWTSFLMRLREPMDAPNWDEFGRFLAMTLLFTVHLKTVRVRMNGVLVLELRKKISPPTSIAFDRRTIRSMSPQRIFELTEVEACHVQMDVRKLVVEQSIVKSIFHFFASAVTSSSDAAGSSNAASGDAATYTTANIFMRMLTGTARASPPTKFAREMERTTKKPPPSVVKLRMVYTSRDEHASSVELCRDSPVLRDLVPFPAQGKVFIGFPTHQTTGIPSHISLHVIPTVERESIDFVDRTLSIWNQEILCTAGVLLRVVYEDEMKAIGGRNSGPASNANATDSQLEAAAHLMTAFTFHPSTPSPYVEQIMKQLFFKGASHALTILSTLGRAEEVTRVRLYDQHIAQFCPSLAMVPPIMGQKCREFLDELRTAGTLQPVSLADVADAVTKVEATEEHVAAFIRWWAGNYSRFTRNDEHHMRCILGAIKVNMEGAPDPSGDGKNRIMTVALQDIRYFANHRIPAALPLPPSTLPISISQRVGRKDFHVGFGWKELPTVTWVQFIAQDPRFEHDAHFTESVLDVLAKQYTGWTTADSATIQSLLASKSCIPTSKGNLLLPSEAYLKSVTLFPDLPIVQLQSKAAVPTAFLKWMGVRSHVDLQVVFDRLADLNWDHVQLVRYLVTVRGQLSDLEMSRLRNTPLLPREEVDERSEAGDAPAKFVASKRRYRAGELFAPIESFRKLKLDLLFWPHRWFPDSDEEQLLSTLGLQKVLLLPHLLQLASTAATPEIRTAALSHLIEHFAKYASQYVASSSPAYLPSTVGDDKLYKPTEIYSDVEVSMLGLPVLAPQWTAYAEMLGVRSAPVADALVAYLAKNPPSTPEMAIEIFGFLAKRTGAFQSGHLRRLQDVPFVPVLKASSSGDGCLQVVHLRPVEVYFSDAEEEEQYAGIFDYVDFGPAANAFLKSCGTKETPTPVELAKQILHDPQHFLDVCGIDRYLLVLRQLAIYSQQIAHANPRAVHDMKRVAFLLAFRKKEGMDVTESKLLSAKEILIIDDTVLQQIFNPWGCPMESLLEDFYASLGSRYISKETKESWIPRGSAQVTSLAQDLQQTIRRRAPLLLYDMDVRGAQGGDTDGAILEQLQSIDVYEVQQIHIVRKLHSAENSCEFTAACQPWSSSRKPATLYVTQRFDYFDVALVLNRAVMRKAKLNDTLLLATLLSTSLENLKKKGFPVDRLITPQREKADALKKVVPAPVAQTAQGSLPTSTPTLSDDMLRLQQAFPDCDPAYMAQLLRANNGDVEQTSNELLDGEYPVASRKGSTQQPQQNGTDDAEATSSSPFLPRQSESGSLASQAAAAIAQQAARAPPQVPSSLVDSVRNLMRGFGGSVGLKGATGLDGTASTSSRTVSQANDRHRRGGQPLTDEMLARSLADSVRSCGGNAPESLITPATELLVESQTSHCETIPAQNLGLVGQVRVGDIRFPFYVDHGVEPQTAHALYLVDDGTPTPSHPIALQCFARVLHELCGVFQLNPGAVHIYYAPMDRTESIAFNANRSLFFNYAYFMDMHAPTILRRLDVRRRSDLEVSLAQLGSTVFTYWFMSFCHELAHNFVGAHDQQFAFYLASYARQHFSRLFDFLQCNNVMQ